MAQHDILIYFLHIIYNNDLNIYGILIKYLLIGTISILFNVSYSEISDWYFCDSPGIGDIKIINSRSYSGRRLQGSIWNINGILTES